MITPGLNGQVAYDPTPASPASPAQVVSLNAFTLSLKRDFEDVSTWGVTNKVYMPGLPDISGTLGGFLDADDLTLIQATQADTPGLLKLVPNTEEPSPELFFEGLAWMDVDINCSMQAPKITGNFRAAGSWTLPS
jgi:hypothetical protein